MRTAPCDTSKSSIRCERSFRSRPVPWNSRSRWKSGRRGGGPLYVDGERVLTGHVDDRHPLPSEIGCPELREHRLAGRCGTEQPGDRTLWQVRLEDPPSAGDPFGDQLGEVDELEGEPFLGALGQREISCGSDESLAAGHLVPSHNRTSPPCRETVLEVVTPSPGQPDSLAALNAAPMTSGDSNGPAQARTSWASNV